MSSFFCSKCGRTVKYSSGTEEHAKQNHEKNWHPFPFLFILVSVSPITFKGKECP